jgi:RimJ/RimL family protein N-acetyltransferase
MPDLGTSFDIESAAAVLERTPAVLDRFLRGLSFVCTRAHEGPDTWSPFDVVGHLIDGEETDWIPRVRILLSDVPDRRFVPFDRFRHLERNRGRNLDDLLDEFATLRRANIVALRAFALTPEALDRTALHPELGPVTLRQHLSTWVTHDLGHIAQIARVMAKQYAAEVGPWRAYIPILGRAGPPSRPSPPWGGDDARLPESTSLAVRVRALGPDDAPAWIALRREALSSSPFAFSASPQDDRGLSLEFMRSSLTDAARSVVFGAFDGLSLVGSAGVVRFEELKFRHKALIWGVFVAPAVRRRGVGSALLGAAVERARSWPGILQIHLAVSETAEAARQMYVRAGFREWGKEPRAVQWEGRFAAEHHLVLDLA